MFHSSLHFRSLRSAFGTPIAVATAAFVLSTQSAWAAPPLDLGGGVTLPVVEVPAGTYVQGSAANEEGRGPDEGKREVILSQKFLIGKSLVTVGQFRHFATDARYVTEAEKGTSGGFGWDGSKLVQSKEYTWRSPGFSQTDDDPVVIVTFADAKAFADWASRKTQMVVRLPSEAEWEVAARGGSRGRFFWGNNDADAEKYAWFAKNAGNQTHAVGGKPPNDLGLVDAVGNVWQWCLDYHGQITPQQATNPLERNAVTWAHSDKPRRVLKGGSWLTNDRVKLRPAARNRATDGSRNADFGFRVVAFEKGVIDPLGFTVPPEVKGSASTPTPAGDTPGAPSSEPNKSDVNQGCWFCGLGVPISALLVWLFWRRKKKQGPFANPISVHVESALAADGFWLFARSATTPTQVVYTVHTAAGLKSGRVSVTPGQTGTFVYTGAAPASVMITSAMPEGMNQGGMGAGGRGAGWGGGGWNSNQQSSSWDNDRNDRHFGSNFGSGSSGGSSWPSAY